MGFRVVSAEIKAEAIRLVVEMNYTVPEACQATGVGPTALRRWVLRWHQEQAEALEPIRPQEQALIESLQAQVALLKSENDVLKKQLPSHLKALLGRTK